MSWPVPWIDVLADIEKLPVTTLVPGHGPVMHDHTYTRRMRELLEAVTSRVRKLAEQASGRRRTIPAIPRLDDVRRKVPAWADKEHDEDWDYIVRTVIERAWRGVRGQG